MSRRVLVLGGTGFIGGRVARAFRDAGDHVTILSRHARGDAGFEAVAADRTDAAVLAAALGGRAFDATLDFAAYDRAGVEALVAVPGFRPGRTIVISTGQAVIVTTAPHPPYREEDSEHPLRPEPPRDHRDHAGWRYGVGKREAERATLEHRARDGGEAVILRLPIVVGAGDTSLRTWAHLERFRDGGPVLLPDGAVRPTRFLWVDDVATACLSLLERWPPPSPIYHLASPAIVPLRAVLEALAVAAHATPEWVDVTDAQLTSAGLDRQCCTYSGHWVSVLDPSRAAREWGFRGTPIEDCIPGIVRAHLERPPGESDMGYAHRARELALARSLKSAGA